MIKIRSLNYPWQLIFNGSSSVICLNVDQNLLQYYEKQNYADIKSDEGKQKRGCQRIFIDYISERGHLVFHDCDRTLFFFMQMNEDINVRTYIKRRFCYLSRKYSPWRSRYVCTL